MMQCAAMPQQLMISPRRPAQGVRIVREFRKRSTRVSRNTISKLCFESILSGCCAVHEIHLYQSDTYCVALRLAVTVLQALRLRCDQRTVEKSEGCVTNRNLLSPILRLRASHPCMQLHAHVAATTAGRCNLDLSEACSTHITLTSSVHRSARAAAALAPESDNNTDWLCAA